MPIPSDHDIPRQRSVGRWVEVIKNQHRMNNKRNENRVEEAERESERGKARQTTVNPELRSCDDENNEGGQEWM